MQLSYPSQTHSDALHSKKRISETREYGFPTSFFFTMLFCGGILLYRVPGFYYLIFSGHLNVNKFTYWSYAIATIFYVLLLAMMFIFRNNKRSFVMRSYILIMVPLIIGMTSVVCFMIIIILQRNDWFILEVTTFGGGTMSLGDTMGANWFLHSLPWIELSALRTIGLDQVWRQCFHRTSSICNVTYLYKNTPSTCHQMTTKRQPESFTYVHVRNYSRGFFGYLMWCCFGHLLLIGLYSSIFNPSIQYPTDINPLYSFAIMFFISTAAGVTSWITIMTPHCNLS